MTSSLSPISSVRWTICALLFASTTLCYLDRAVLGVLAPTLQKQLTWSETDYSHAVMAFQLAYAIGLALVGRLLDAIGVRLGFALAVGLWCFAAMSHALVATVGGFIVMRFLLGLGEAGNFPAAIKTVGIWFPVTERALATGIFNSGASIGTLAAPFLVVPLVAYGGWQAAFCATGAIGLAWPLAWWWWYGRALRGSGSETGSIDGATGRGPSAQIPSPSTTPGLRSLLRLPATWAFVIGKALTDPVWWFYLYWFPKFLSAQGVTLDGLPAPMAVVYIVADVGSIAGGWLSSHLIARGWSRSQARVIAMTASVVCIVPVAAAPAVHDLWGSVALVALAAAGHQAWSANLFTLTSDHLPQATVGTVVGIGGTAGALGGMVMAYGVGKILEVLGYQPLFIIGAIAYVVALLLIRLLLARVTAPPES